MEDTTHSNGALDNEENNVFTIHDSAPENTAAEETFDAHGDDGDDDGAPFAYLMPRLAAYKSSSSAASSLSGASEQVDNEEETTGGAALRDDAADEGEGPEEEEEIKWDDEALLAHNVEGVDDEENDAMMSMSVSSGGDNQPLEDEDEKENTGDISSGSGGALEDFTSTFAHSRIKALLRFDADNKSLISRDATTAVAEAVALIVRDLATAAAAEARRRNKRTVAYEDVAKAVQIFDRFAFLNDVVPSHAQQPASSTATGAADGTNSKSKSKHTGANNSNTHHSSNKRATRTKSATAPPKAKNSQQQQQLGGRGGAHHAPPHFTGMRQETLRF